MAISFAGVMSFQLSVMSLRVRCVMLQKRKRMVAADSSALMILTMRATCDGSLVNCENKLAVSMKNGAPGG